MIQEIKKNYNETVNIPQMTKMLGPQNKNSVPPKKGWEGERKNRLRTNGVWK